MIRVEFQATPEGSEMTVEAAASDALVDVCDTCRSPVLFSCRSATCGTCRVEVLDGGELFEPPGPAERETLDAFDAPPSHRLACSARFGLRSGLVRLRWAGDDP